MNSLPFLRCPLECVGVGLEGEPVELLSFSTGALVLEELNSKTGRGLTGMRGGLGRLECIRPRPRSGCEGRAAMSEVSACIGKTNGGFGSGGL